MAGSLAVDDLLCLSTIHSAKGLERHSVLVLWLVDGRFPSAYSMQGEDELEEERQLLYFGISRELLMPMQLVEPFD